MYKVFSFTKTDEAAPYMDKKILRYIDEQITDSFECFKDCDILAFDWYDVQSEKKEDFKMLLYLEGKGNGTDERFRFLPKYSWF